MSPWILAFGVLVSLCLTQAQKTLDEEDPNSLANSREADIAIVYHIGEDTKPREVKRVIAPMLISILDNADIDGGAVRVALVNFATSSSVIFSLNTYQRKTQVLDAMRRFISPRQRSRISDPSTAVKTLKSRIFQTVHGDRPNVPNLVILVTDTPSYVDGDYMAKVEELKNSGVYIFTIGLGTADRIELARVASQPSSLYSLFFSRIAKEDMILPVKTSLSRVVNALRANPSQPTQAPSDSSSDPCRADEMDLIFLIDSSTSVTEPNFLLIKDFLKFFLIPSDVDNDRVRVGIVIYSTRVKVQFQMSDYVGKKRELYKAIDRIPYSAGSTNTYGGLRTMRTKMFTPDTGDRPDVPNVCILITDGVSNIFSSKTIPEAELAKNEGIHIYVIGIGLKQKEEVSAIASKPLKDNLFTVDAFEDMVHLRELVFNSLQEGCGAPTVAPTPVYSDIGYDVIFMLDGSANNRYFGWMLGFAANFASQMSTDDGVWRVGAVTYSSGGPSLIFNLNRYGWKRDIVHAIQNDMNNNPGGRPDLGQAFQYVRSNMFTAANGDRPNAVNYVVVMTASDESSDQDATYAGAQALKDDLVGIYTVGINLGDTTELDTVTTKFLDEHQWLINEENDMSELPGIVMFNMEEADPITLAPSTLAPTPVYSDTGYDVIFMLDGSANNRYFGWMLGFAANFASQMSIDDGVWRVGAMTYSSGGPSLTFNLNRYGWKRDIVHAIQNDVNNNPGGRPDLGQAFQYVRSNMFTAANGDRPNAVNYVVVMTASDESSDQDATYAGAQALKDDLVGIYTVGINLGDTTELDTVTTKFLDEHQWLINQESEMSELPGMIIYNMEEADPITLAPSTLSPTPVYSDTGYDVIFMLDGSANNRYFGWMLGFAANFASQMSIDDGVWRVGAMTYSSGGPSLTFNLNRYGWKRDVVHAIQNDVNNNPGGRPDLGQAFQYVRSNMFTAANGDRPNAVNYVVVMTASDESSDQDATYAGAQALKDDLVGIYTVGINLGDTTELDTVTTKFLDEHQWLINEENEMSELPGMIIYNMEEADPVTRAPLTLAPTPSPTPGTSETGYDIIFMFDGTVNDEYFTWMRQTAMILASVINFDAGEFRIGAMTFTDQPEINFNLNDYQWQSDVVAALTNRTQNSPGGRPDLASAFDFVRTNMLTESSGDRPRAQNFVVLMTASEESVDSEAARSASHALQRVGDSGTGIFSVGFNLDNTQELDAVTTKPLQDFRYLLSGTDGIARLPGFIGRVIYETKQVIIPEAPRSRAYSPTGKDIIFMFDGTANDKQFSWMKNLTKDFVLKNDIDSGEYRVGAMTYGGTPTLDFDLDEYGWQSDVVKGLTDKPQNSPGGRPDLAGAFDFVRTNMLTKTSGDRPRAQNFVVLMTASEESVDSEAARSASHALQRVGDSGTGIFSVGFNLDNTQELDSVTTKPLDQFKFIVNDEAGISVLPGRISNILPRVGVITLPQSTPATATQGIETTRAVIDGTGYDIILMFDGTVKNKHFTWMKILANNIANQLDIDSGDYKVGAVTFTDTPTKVFNLNEYDEQSEIANAIDSNLENSPGGRPDLARAFDFVRTNMLTESSGDRPRAQNFVVLMTASEESMDSEAARSASEALQRVGESGTGIFSVGFNLDNTHELDAVTTKPLDQFQFLVNGRPGLRKIPGIMKPVIMSDPVISVPDPAPVSPTMKHRAYSPTGKDIVFMFDGTANDEHFSWMKNLTKDFVSENDIDSGEFRVGAMTYGDTPTLDFDLDEYGWQSDVVRGITDKPQNRPGGRPDLAGAFDFVRTNMLTKSSGDRPRAQNFVVLMTASEESGDSEAARSASHALQRVGDSGTGIFSVGFNLDNTEELDGVTTKPLDQFQFLVNGRSGVRQIPGMLKTVIASDPGISVPDPVPVSPTMRHRAYSPTGKDIVFMFDGTANDEHFSWMKNLTKDFVSENDIDSGEYRVGAMTYGNTPTLDFDLDEYGWQSDVVTGITDKPQNKPGGRPDLASAFDFVRTNMLTKSSGDRPRAQNFVVLMTASEESVDSEAARSASKALQRVGDSGTGIFSVGFNLDNTQELDSVTTKPLDQFQFLVNGRSGLRKIPGRLKTVIKSDPGISVPDPVPVSPTMRHRAYSPTGKDIVFMFDGTANDEHFSWMKNLTKDFVSENDIDSGEYRVGAMTYGDIPTLDFDLDEYGWQSDVVRGITDKPQNKPGGRPDLAGAFDFVRTNMLTKSSGDRPRAQNFVVLMTASEESVDSEAARSASKALQRVGDSGTGIFSVGFNLDNTQELDGVTTKPLDQFQFLVNGRSGLRRIPGRLKTVIKSDPGISVPVPDPVPVSPTMRHRAYSPTGKDIVFMFDGTANDEHFSWMKNLTKDFVSKNDIDSGEYRVGAMTYGDTPNLDFDLDEYGWQSDVVTGITDKPQNSPGGRPDLARAFDFVRTNMLTESSGDRPRAQNFVVLMTASEKSVDSEAARSASKALQRVGDYGTRIFSVGFNLDNTQELDDITTKPLQDFRYLVNTLSGLAYVPESIGTVISKPKSSPSIQVTSPDWEGKCGGSDVIFMLDGTVDPQKYRLFKHFAKNFTQTMNPNRGSDEFRVGGMAFTQSPSKGFHLSDTDPIVSLDVLDSFNRPGGTPNLAQAIDIVSICMFTAENGDRPRADNYMVILTGSDACLSLSRAAGAAKRFQETGGRIFTVGVNLSNTSHLEAITSKPLDAYQYLVSSEADFGILPMAMKATMRKPPHMTSSSDHPVQQVQHAASPRYTMTNRKEPIVVSLNLNFTLNNAP